ncbi:MAG TPA: phosphatidylserine decarboxylase family protein [Nitrospirales bacterium]|nr:phosphatidylserine decarboxylase family protein [Nitrospiraceae bacterium]HNP30560.1 phosphatidylserine decarboxylase family protein [Nitrospirales bacterium]
MSDQAKGIPVAKEGLPFILGGGILTFGCWMGGVVWLTCLMASLTLFTAWFFRNPARTIPQGGNLIVSPGDGAVVAVEQEFEHRFLKEPSIRISIFLNVFNVHINRIPAAGVLQDVVYSPGRFLVASRPEASAENEQNALMLRRSDGKKILCVQIAGLIARRIVCWVKPGEQVEKGERFGLIRFGSRMDVYLPHDSLIQVKVGDKVKGGSSVLAELLCVEPS